MNKLIFILIFLPIAVFGQVRDTLTLFECHEMAVSTDPVYREKALLEIQNDLRLKNIKTNWYPSLDMNGSYTYQSEVVELAEALPYPGIELPVMPHYNYKVTLDVKQNIYDGGITQSQKEYERASFEVNRQKVEVDLYGLKERVNFVYFYLVILHQQEATISLMLDELAAREKVVRSGVENGIMLPTNQDILQAEILQVEQQLHEIRISRLTALGVLEKLIDKKVSYDTELLMPETDPDIPGEGTRPEFELFDLQMVNLNASKKLTGSRRKPKFYVFGTFGLGNPALNFFKDEIRGYYIVGAGMHWNIWDYSKTSREKQIMTVQQDIIRTKKDAFSKNLDIMLDEEMASIKKLEESVRMDEEIVGIRERITRNAASQLENGVITSTEYVTELNAETRSKIQLETHRIQLIQSRISYLTKKGML